MLVIDMSNYVLKISSNNNGNRFFFSLEGSRASGSSDSESNGK